MPDEKLEDTSIELTRENLEEIQKQRERQLAEKQSKEREKEIKKQRKKLRSLFPDADFKKDDNTLLSNLIDEASFMFVTLKH